jgi:hypothetical protein
MDILLYPEYLHNSSQNSLKEVLPFPYLTSKTIMFVIDVFELSGGVETEAEAEAKISMLTS